MNSQRNITVAFTGHRTYCGEANSDLHQTILRLCEEGFTRFLCGMAWGFDLAAGEAVAEAKKHCSEIELVAVVPYDGFGGLFRGDDAEQYGQVMAAADEVVVVSEQGGDAAFRRRNDYLVDNASIVVAWFDGEPRGGTAYTVRRARRKHIEIVNLYPQQQLKLGF